MREVFRDIKKNTNKPFKKIIRHRIEHDYAGKSACRDRLWALLVLFCGQLGTQEGAKHAKKELPRGLAKKGLKKKSETITSQLQTC